MPSRDYRIYKIDSAGKILGAALVYSAPADDAVLQLAKQMRSIREGVSVWQEARLVLELGPKAAGGAATATVVKSA